MADLREIDREIAGPRILFWSEFQLDDFSRFVFGGFPPPAPNCIDGRLGQHGMSAFDRNFLHAAIRRNDSLHLGSSLQRHASRQVRINWRSPRNDLARLLPGEKHGRHDCQ